jgi:hypothetical protein
MVQKSGVSMEVDEVVPYAGDEGSGKNQGSGGGVGESCGVEKQQLFAPRSRLDMTSNGHDEHCPDEACPSGKEEVADYF